MIPHPKIKNGFTLLEVLVSITILALMALMIARIFSESTRAVERGKDQALLDETARLLMDYVEQDISQALIRTNVAFRVHQVAGGDALYFVSTGVRRKTETIPRDTAPMLLKSGRTISTENGLVPNLNRQIITESALGTEDTIGKLIQASDYYFTKNTQTAKDFIPLHGGSPMGQGEFKFTDLLENTSGTTSHAMLTFLEFSINADSSWNYDDDAGQPDPKNMPRFVDMVIGLISSTDMEQAMRLHSAQGEVRGREYIEKNERIYTRRIFMRNQGTDQLTF